MQKYYFSTKENAGLEHSGPIEATSIYHAMLQLREKYPNHIFHKVNSFPFSDYDLGIHEEYLEWSQDSGFKQQTVEEKIIKVIRAEIIEWSKSIDALEPKLAWVCAYWIALGYLDPAKLNQREEYRLAFESFVERLRPYVGDRPAATKYEFGLGCCEDTDEEKEKTRDELAEMLESFGLIITEDTFRICGWQVEVDAQVIQARHILANLYENASAEKYWRSLTPEQKAEIENPDWLNPEEIFEYGKPTPSQGKI